MTLDLVRDLLGWALMLSGGFFVVAGAVGLVRFPDVYTRIHAAGVTDTLGAELILIGMATQADSWTVVVRIFFIMLFLLFTSPVSTHALAHAAWVGGLAPLLGPDLKRFDAETTEGEAP